MSNHTPGPWRHRPHKHDDWGIIKAEDGMPVASAAMLARFPEERSEWDKENGCFPEPPEIAANAKLMASSPSLQSILMDMVGESTDTFHNSDDMSDQWKVLVWTGIAALWESGVDEETIRGYTKSFEKHPDDYSGPCDCESCRPNGD